MLLLCCSVYENSYSENTEFHVCRSVVICVTILIRTVMSLCCFSVVVSVTCLIKKQLSMCCSTVVLSMRCVIKKVKSFMFVALLYSWLQVLAGQ